MQIVDLPENTTKDKIRGFSSFKKGWHFGEGVPPSKELLKIAVNMADRVALSGFRSDAFPGIDGEIMVTAYHGGDYLEFTFETDGTVTFVREKGETEIAYEEKLTFKQAKKRLNDFGIEKIWKNLSGLSTPPIMTQTRKSSKALRLGIHQDQEYHLYLSRVSKRKLVPTSASIMKGSHRTRSSSGQSKKESYLKNALSSSIPVIPAMNAMAI